MHTVLADDFSGAAEVAGEGFRYGFTAGVQLNPGAAPHFGLTVIDLDSRSGPVAQAVQLVRSVGQRNCLFKKIDSVLRGHVLAEIQPFLESGQYMRALVVPFNPGLGRSISGGIYRINGCPISETLFGNDPEYPALESRVASMLRARAGDVRVCSLSDPFPTEGIVVGEGGTTEELLAWAKRIDGRTLPVGAAPFLGALLQTRGHSLVRVPYREALSNVLVISGTTAGTVDWREVLRTDQVSVHPMPESVFEHGIGRGVSQWAEEVAVHVRKTGFAVASIAGGRILDKSHSSRLVGHLADLAALVFARCPVDHLWLEGGATSAAVIRKSGWMELEVVGEWARGVVQLRPTGGGPLITVKPGSYPWTYSR